MNSTTAATKMQFSLPKVKPPQPPPSVSRPNSHLPNTPISSSSSETSPLQSHPLYAQTSSNLSVQIKEKILCLEILGVDAGRALSRNPSLHSASLHSLNSVVSFLRSKGIHHKDLPKILGMCPGILTSDIANDLIPVFDFLSDDLRVPDHYLRRVINKNPRILVSSAKDQLKPALFFLRRLGISDLEALAYNDSILLVSSVERTLIPKLKFLEEALGLRREEAAAMVRRCPALFTFSVERNFKPKLDYLIGEMRRKVEEVREFPQYFAFSLDKRIKPRHEEVVKRGMEMALPLMLKSTDEEFRELLRRGSG